MLQAKLADDRGNILCPRLGFRVLLGRIWRFRHAVAAKIEGDEVERVRKLALVLLAPAKVILRPPMDEEHRWSIGFAPFAHVQLHTTSANHRMNFHLDPPFVDPVSDGSRSGLEEVLYGPLKKSGQNVGI